MEPITGNIPCPHCDQTFYTSEQLFIHIKKEHKLKTDLDRSDFYKIDGHYVAATNGFHLSVEPAKAGFRLVVYGTLMEKPEPVPSHGEPTSEQWAELLIVANRFEKGLRIAKRRER